MLSVLSEEPSVTLKLLSCLQYRLEEMETRTKMIWKRGIITDVSVVVILSAVIIAN